MKKFLDSAGKFLMGLFGVLATILGFVLFFKKGGADILNEDNDLADKEAEIDSEIAEKSKESVPADLGDSDIEDYWSDK